MWPPQFNRRGCRRAISSSTSRSRAVNRRLVDQDLRRERLLIGQRLETRERARAEPRKASWLFRYQAELGALISAPRGRGCSVQRLRRVEGLEALTYEEALRDARS